MTSRSIYLNSKNALVADSLNSSCTWYLNGTIVFPLGSEVTVDLARFQMVNVHPNVVTDQVVSVNNIGFVIPSGYYNGDSLASTVSTKTQGMGITCSYPGLFRLQFTSASGTTFWVSGSSQFGLSSTPQFSDASGNLTAGLMNLTGLMSIQITTNLLVDNFDSRTYQVASNLLEVVPCEVGYGQALTYRNLAQVKTTLLTSSMTYLSVSLSDQDDSPLSLSGTNWELALNFSITQKEFNNYLTVKN